jgi:hypothetical protein
MDPKDPISEAKAGTPGRFFADTNICSKWESDPALGRKWQQVKCELEGGGHRYVACPEVLIELLCRLEDPQPEYFSKDLKSFAFLASQPGTEFLEFPGAFVLKAVLNCESPVSRFSPTHFKQWLECVLAAPSRSDLSAGNVELYESRLMSFGMDLKIVGKQHREGKDSHVERCNRLRKSGHVPVREEFAAGLLYQLNIIPRAGDVESIAHCLDAAYEYERFLFSDPKYKFENHTSDWVDQQLLYYLSDPGIRIITNDSALRNRCGSSAQVSRIIVI